MCYDVYSGKMKGKAVQRTHCFFLFHDYALPFPAGREAAAAAEDRRKRPRGRRLLYPAEEGKSKDTEIDISYVIEKGGKTMSELINNVPKLSSAQKSAMKDLMTDYFAAKDEKNDNGVRIFLYLQKMAREGYAWAGKLTNTDEDDTEVNGCINGSGQNYMNGATFAQMIWMGRPVSEFRKTPTTAINSVFNKSTVKGYYFDFLGAQMAYHIERDATTSNPSEYYSANTYYDDDGNRRFTPFDDASAMAAELYRKGYEIPYAEADVGDLVFYRTESLIDNSEDSRESACFRYITQVGLVYEKEEGEPPVIMEFADVYTSPIGKNYIHKISDAKTFALVRGASLNYRVAMCARHLAAFGHADNVPQVFGKYRNTNFRP